MKPVNRQKREMVFFSMAEGTCGARRLPITTPRARATETGMRRGQLMLPCSRLAAEPAADVAS